MCELALSTKMSILNPLENFFNKENKMDIKLVHVPKFHCELNPIEMYWANLKYYFKKHNDQTTSEDVVTKRILEAREQYAQMLIRDF